MRRTTNQRRAVVDGCCKMPTALTTNDIFPIWKILLYE